MNDSPYHLFARQFVDMWQKQLSSMIADESQLQAMMAMMQQFGGTPHGTSPAHAPISSHDAGPVVDELQRRLIRAEARIAELERIVAEQRHAGSGKAGTEPQKPEPA